MFSNIYVEQDGNVDSNMTPGTSIQSNKGEPDNLKKTTKAESTDNNCKDLWTNGKDDSFDWYEQRRDFMLYLSRKWYQIWHIRN